MKVGIVVAYHNFVNKFILPSLNSILDHVKCEKVVYVFDNETEHKDNDNVVDFCQNNNDFIYIRVDDQSKNGGLTGAWNKGIHLSILEECDVIFIINDDILINETWEHFVSSIVDDNVIYGPITNNPGHAWINEQGVKIQYSANNSRDESPVEVGFINGFCFGCTAKTFSNNMFDDLHYFNPAFPFEGNESEFQNRLFSLKPSRFIRNNVKNLDALDAHNRAVVVPKCYVYHFKNNAWRISGGGKYSKEQYI